ncbi:MAG TPA: hypothetical protein VJ506_09450 [Candidatus Limnocylindrales bacterium]|nr:hypothetical protein [Candidatus Limnocylindrales bacterium]
MDLVMVALRLLHIVSGVLWAGGAALFFFYLEPTMNKLGPDAEPFVDEVMNKRKAPVYFMVVSTLAVLGGALLYWRDSSGLSSDWVTSATGLAFGFGGLCALVAWLGGNLLIPSGVRTISAVGAEMKAAGGPPSAELVGRMHAAQARLRLVGLIDIVLIFTAIVGMASARYLG